MSIRASIKALLARLPLGLGIIEFCQDCGVEQPIVWTARDDLWLRVMESPSGVVCPKCFTRRAENIGIALRWLPTVEKP